MKYFHFTLGPVQGFVAQARRTRDFWAGSFILSWLSAVAMKEVQKQAGDESIVFPKPGKAFLEALEKGGAGSPRQGSIPNRFKAVVNADFDPEKVEAAVRNAWHDLAEHTWLKDLAHCEKATRDIWDRQVKAFWEIAWAITPDEKDSSVLSRIKNWRTHFPPDEFGVKCMMMEGWQELSGVERPGKDGNPFWDGLLKSGKEGIKTDLRESEQLCAIAFIKRRFARHFGTFSATMPGGWTLQGWHLSNGMPSVHYMAAAPWLAQLIKKAAGDPDLHKQMWAFHNTACALTDGYSESGSNIRCVKDALGNTAEKEWAALDGTVYFDAMLENPKLWGDKSDDAKELLGQLKSLRKQAKIDAVSPFYAVLLMDGDQLGMYMGDADNQTIISDALAKFTGGVPKIVEDENGALVYAGGDDVLALLPLEDAMRCALKLRQLYMDSFDECGFPVSISAAIEYAHIKMPLGKVLGDAHDLLNNIAKEKCGRDSLACRVWKPGGKALEWGMPWVKAIDGDRVVLEQLANNFRNGGGNSEDAAAMSSKFLYRIRERFEILNPEDGRAPVLDPEQAKDLMAMEYLNSGASNAKSMEEARLIIAPLLEQCRPKKRISSKTEAGKFYFEPSPRCEADAALLVRFIAHKGIER